MRFFRVVAVTLVLGVTLQAACGDSVSPPVPGELTVMLQTPNTGDRSIQMRIVGAGATNVVSASAGYASHSRPAADEIRAAVFGPLTTGPLIRFTVPDVARHGEYVATIVEVGDEANQLRASLAGYSASVVKQP